MAVWGRAASEEAPLRPAPARAVVPFRPVEPVVPRAAVRALAVLEPVPRVFPVVAVDAAPREAFAVLDPVPDPRVDEAPRELVPVVREEAGSVWARPGFPTGSVEPVGLRGAVTAPLSIPGPRDGVFGTAARWAVVAPRNNFPDPEDDDEEETGRAAPVAPPRPAPPRETVEEAGVRAVFVPRRTDPEADGVERIAAPDRSDFGASAARAARAAW